MQHEPETPLRIRTPCPKRWEELVGDERKRFCSECSLHVHNAAELTQREARALVEDATSRVCMRIEYDAQGAPLHRRTRVEHWMQGALAAGAALLAACQGGSPAADPEPAAPVEPPSKMGKVAAPHVLGDVAAPPVEPGSVHMGGPGDTVPPPLVLMGGMTEPLPPPVERLGEVVRPADPAPVPPK